MNELKLHRHPESGEIVPEEWRDIKGSNGYYQVSNYGRVRSWKKARWGRSKAPKMLSQYKRNDGYVVVTLWLNKKMTSKFVHILVGEAFILNPENKPCINHKDSVKTNNYVKNIEWVTYKENTSHLFDNCRGNPPVGERCAQSKLKEKDVIDIRAAYSSGGVTQKDLADEHNVDQGLISKIINNKIWDHI